MPKQSADKKNSKLNLGKKSKDKTPKNQEVDDDTEVLEDDEDDETPTGTSEIDGEEVEVADQDAYDELIDGKNRSENRDGPGRGVAKAREANDDKAREAKDNEEMLPAKSNYGSLITTHTAKKNSDMKDVAEDDEDAENRTTAEEVDAGSNDESDAPVEIRLTRRVGAGTRVGTWTWAEGVGREGFVDDVVTVPYFVAVHFSGNGIAVAFDKSIPHRSSIRTNTKLNKVNFIR